MTIRKTLRLIYFICLLLSGCGTQLALSGQAREDYLKSIKAYGEYFVKPGMSREEWRRDWVACGGMADGGYSSNALSGSTTEVLINASKQKRRDLSNCMQSKGYEKQNDLNLDKKE